MRKGDVHCMGKWYIELVHVLKVTDMVMRWY